VITSKPSKRAETEGETPPVRLTWRRPALRRIEALDAQAKGRAPHDALHLS